MRLIDADRVTNILEQLQAHSLSGKMDIVNALYLISITPTAYDVDKVLNELEEELSQYDEGLTEEAIDIVKRGGIDEE